jgi:hypothetical protein
VLTCDRGTRRQPESAADGEGGASSEAAAGPHGDGEAPGVLRRRGGAEEVRHSVVELPAASPRSRAPHRRLEAATGGARRNQRRTHGRRGAVEVGQGHARVSVPSFL